MNQIKHINLNLAMNIRATKFWQDMGFSWNEEQKQLVPFTNSIPIFDNQSSFIPSIIILNQL